MSDPSNNPFSLHGKVALVTGASRGIGAAIAAGFARAGARVVGVGRSARATVAVPDVDYRRCDVTDRAAFSACCESVDAECGRLDVLVNAAGLSLGTTGDPDRDAEAFDRTLDVNLRAAYHCSMAASPLMAASGGGAIVNVTSIGSLLGFPGNPGYVAAKGGLRMLTKALAVDLGASGIRVNNLAPGYVRTAMTERSYEDPELRGQRTEHTILGRWGDPEDMVGPAVFLASAASAYITGQDLVVDGGWTAKGLVGAVPR